MDAEDPIVWPIPGQSGEPSRWRGVNRLLDPRRIQDDQLVNAQNLYPVSPDEPSKRGSLDLWFQTGYTQTSQLPLAVMGIPFKAANKYMMLTRNIGSQLTTLAQPFASDGSVPNNVTPADLIPVITTYRPGMVAFDSKILMAMGPPYNSHGAWLYSAKIDVNKAPAYPAHFMDSHDLTHSGQQNAGPNFLKPIDVGAYSPRVVATYADRVVWGNFGPGFENLILFSDSLHNIQYNANLPSQQVDGGLSQTDDIPFVIASDGGGFFSRAFRVGAMGDDDRIVAMKEIMLTAIGSTPSKGLLVLREKSVYLFTGEPNQTTDNQTTFPLIGNLVMSRVAFDCGCSSAETVVTTPYGLFWAGPDDVWFFAYGQVPLRVGSYIRPVLQRTPASLRYRWHAAYWNGTYRLAVDSDGISLGDDSPCGEQWWLDLRNGPPQGAPEVEPHENAEWWGPQVYNIARGFAGGNTTLQVGTRTMCVGNRGDQQALVGVEEGETATAHISIAVAKYDGPNEYDATLDPSLGPGAVTGHEILLDVQSKEYDLGNGRLDKMVQGLQMDLYTDIDAIVNVDFIMDGGKITDTVTKALGQLGWAVGVDPVGSLPFFKATQGIQAYPTAGQRDIGKRFAVRIYDTAGYYIVTGVNDTVIFTTGDGAIYHRATIPAGFYTSVTVLATAVATAMSIDTNTFSSAVDGTGHRQIIKSISTWYPGYSDSDLGGSHNPSTNALYVAGTFSTAQFRSTRKVMALLGIDTSVAGTTLNGTTITAVAVAPFKTVPLWEIASMAANVFVFPREPT